MFYLLTLVFKPRNFPYTNTLPFIGEHTFYEKSNNILIKSLMRKIITLVVGISAGVNVIESFFGNLESERMFGFEINIWVYRLIWSLIAFIIFYDHFKKVKSEKKD